MGTAAAEHNSTKTLLRYVKKGATGRVTVGSGEHQVVAYLLSGELVAATSHDDGARLARRLALEGLLEETRASELQEVARQSGSIIGDLLEEISYQDLDRVMLDQFMENVARFTGDTSRASFRSQPTVFVDNIQIGLDTNKVIKQCSATWDSAQSLDPDLLLLNGSTSAQSPEQELICRLLQMGPLRSGTLVQKLPMEQTASRALISHMVRINILVPYDAQTHQTLQNAEADTIDESVDRSYQEAMEREVERVVPLQTEDLLWPEESSEPETAPALYDTQPTLEGVALGDIGLSDLNEHSLFDDDDADLDPSLDLSEDISEDLTAEERALLQQLQARERHQEVDTSSPAQTASQQGAGNLSSLNAWLSAATDVEEDELDAFGDHDYDRGSVDNGAFSTQSHNLDRVEVATLDESKEPAESMAPEDEPIPVGSAPAARFSAPVLSEDEAIDKLEVANDVLRVVVEAFDSVEGHGRGRAVVQLLVDGSPARYSALFSNIPINQEGLIPEDQLLHNLYSRPPSEHRRLFNQGMADLLERALSSAADELPDDDIDTVLEKVVGYRQRLGL